MFIFGSLRKRYWLSRLANAGRYAEAIRRLGFLGVDTEMAVSLLFESLLQTQGYRHWDMHPRSRDIAALRNIGGPTVMRRFDYFFDIKNTLTIDRLWVLCESADELRHPAAAQALYELIFDERAYIYKTDAAHRLLKLNRQQYRPLLRDEYVHPILRNLGVDGEFSFEEEHVLKDRRLLRSVRDANTAEYLIANLERRVYGALKRLHEGHRFEMVNSYSEAGEYIQGGDWRVLLETVNYLGQAVVAVKDKAVIPRVEKLISITPDVLIEQETPAHGWQKPRQHVKDNEVKAILVWIVNRLARLPATRAPGNR